MELYRRGAVEFEQDGALGTLTIQWTGSEGSIDIDVDDYSGVSDADAAKASFPHEEAIATEGGDVDE